MKSAVRHSIPAVADVEPKALEEACFRCTVPKEKMRGNPKMEWLLENENEMFWTAPGRYVLSWPLRQNRPYDVVTCIQRPSDVPPGRWGVSADPEEARKDFQDFCPEIRELMSHMESAEKWTLTTQDLQKRERKSRRYRRRLPRHDPSQRIRRQLSNRRRSVHQRMPRLELPQRSRHRHRD